MEHGICLRYNQIVHVGYAAVMLLVLSACAGSAASYTGRPANPESVTPLRRGDVRELQWQTNDLMMHATYALEADQLDIAGTIKLQSRLANFPVLEYLRVNVHALDEAGVILASYPLWSSAYGRELFFVNWSFQRRYIVPATTSALTFSYRGRMRDGGGRGPLRNRDDGDAVTWDFWRTP
jgi:hypothetical protein